MTPELDERKTFFCLCRKETNDGAACASLVYFRLPVAFVVLSLGTLGRGHLLDFVSEGRQILSSGRFITCSYRHYALYLLIVDLRFIHPFCQSHFGWPS